MVRCRVCSVIASESIDNILRNGIGNGPLFTYLARALRAVTEVAVKPRPSSNRILIDDHSPSSFQFSPGRIIEWPPLQKVLRLVSVPVGITNASWPRELTRVDY